MVYKCLYKTPKEFDNMMISDGKFLTGLFFVGSKDEHKFSANAKEKELPIFDETKKWLDIYFSGEEPKFTPKYKLENISEFRKSVTDIMNEVPYGETMTYGEIAQRIAAQKGIKRMSAQAVGGAVGANPICIIIPCHRVMGANGNITGYGGGVKNKIALLKLENKKSIKIYKI